MPKSKKPVQKKAAKDATLTAFAMDNEVIIKPTSDLFIGVLLSKKSNEDVLVFVINAVLTDHSKTPPIVSATVLNPISLPDFAVEKYIVLDVLVQDETGRIYCIEVQTYPHPAFNDRILFGWAKTYSGQAPRGAKYETLQPVYAITITEFTIFQESNKLHLVFNAREIDEPEIVLSDHFLVHLLRLYPVLKGNLQILKTVSRRLAYWICFLVFGKESEETMQHLYQEEPLIKEAFEQTEIRKARTQFDRYCADPQMRDMERRHQQSIILHQHDVETARKQGLEQGIAEGEQRGKATGEQNRSREIALIMKSKGYGIKDIADLTGLTKQEIEAL